MTKSCALNFLSNGKPRVKDQASIRIPATYMEQLDPFIGDMPLTHIDDEHLPHTSSRSLIQLWESRSRTGTVNIALQRVIRVLILCARQWRDEAPATTRRRNWIS